MASASNPSYNSRMRQPEHFYCSRKMAEIQTQFRGISRILRRNIKGCLRIAIVMLCYCFVECLRDRWRISRVSRELSRKAIFGGSSSFDVCFKVIFIGTKHLCLWVMPEIPGIFPLYAPLCSPIVIACFNMIFSANLLPNSSLFMLLFADESQPLYLFCIDCK